MQKHLNKLVCFSFLFQKNYPPRKKLLVIIFIKLIKNCAFFIFLLLSLNIYRCFQVFSLGIELWEFWWGWLKGGFISQELWLEGAVAPRRSNQQHIPSSPHELITERNREGDGKCKCPSVCDTYSRCVGGWVGGWWK